MKTVLQFGTRLLAILVLGGCTHADVANHRTARPDNFKGRRVVTGSNVPRSVGRPVGASLATSDPYTHAADVDRELGVTTPTANAGTTRN